MIVLVALFGLLSLLGWFGVPVAYGWWTALRIALAGMFLLTASAHWGKRRLDLIRMVPASLPRPELLVTLTGIWEMAGALFLLFPQTARWAALSLLVLLLFLFPANVRASRQRLTIGGRATLPLMPRALVQIVFLAAAEAVCWG